MRKYALAIAAAVLISLWLLFAREEEEPAQEREDFPPNPRGPFQAFDRIIIIGLPTSGKTYLAAKLTRDCPRVIYFDPCMDYARAAGAAEYDAAELIADPSPLMQSRFRIAAVPEEETIAAECAAIVKLARAAGDCVVVLDEVGDYNQEADRVLKKLARNGRHDGVVSIFVSQVATDIPRTVRRLATVVYSFKQVDPDDLDVLAERYGEEFAAKVKNAKIHEANEWRLPLESSRKDTSHPPRPARRPPTASLN